MLRQITGHISAEPRIAHGSIGHCQTPQITNLRQIGFPTEIPSPKAPNKNATAPSTIASFVKEANKAMSSLVKFNEDHHCVACIMNEVLVQPLPFDPHIIHASSARREGSSGCQLAKTDHKTHLLPPAVIFLALSPALLLLLGCNSISSATSTSPLRSKPPVVLISSPPGPVLAGTTFKFSSEVVGSADKTLNWAVGGVVGGTSHYGTITAEGLYKAPTATNEAVTISAILQSDPSAQGTAQIQVIAPASSPGEIGFSFSLPKSAATSAGVYDLQGNLLRTLWSNQNYPAGPRVESWDGHDNSGKAVPSAKYQIRVLYNNVTYNWGLIGDTAASWEGPNTWDTESYTPIGMAVIGQTAYVANYYAEGRPNAASFALSQPQMPAPLFNVGQCVELANVTTDGHLVYFANTGNGWPGSSAFVMAYDPGTSQPYNFPAGSSTRAMSSASYSCEGSRALLSGVIDYVPPTQDNQGTSRTNIPTGIAVQTHGNVLAVSHGAFLTFASQDIIKLFDKTSGALLGRIKIPNPQSIAFAPNGDLWAISGHSVVQMSSIGTKNDVVVTLNGLSAPLAIAVDPSTSDVLVVDGGHSQQVKHFSASGKLLSTYGDLGGYTDCNPTVTKTRLFLDTTAGDGYVPLAPQSLVTFLAVFPDSSFWVGDPGNARLLHISSTGQYIEQIAFLRFLYYVTVDHGNPSRVFADDLEYAVDYSEPLTPGDPDPQLGGDGSWSLAKNWSVCLANNYLNSFDAVQTFPNGKTYAAVRNRNVVNRLSGAYVDEVAELPASGPLKFSGQFLEDSVGDFQSFDHAGDLTWWAVNDTSTGLVQTAYQQTLSGYSDDSWPVWGSPYPLASVPWGKTANPSGTNGWTNDPGGTFGSWMSLTPQPTIGGVIATFNPNPGTPGQDYHVGGVKMGGTDWSWKASPGAMITSPDEHGTFTDIDNGNNGIGVLVEGSNVFEGYTGMYATFSNQWMHWSEDGLLIGQFGHPADDYPENGPISPEAAGNVLTMATASAGDNIYLYNSDESYHPGIHQWKISGLDSVHELIGSASLGGTVALK